LSTSVSRSAMRIAFPDMDISERPSLGADVKVIPTPPCIFRMENH
jgi:hypothetical protein